MGLSGGRPDDGLDPDRNLAIGLAARSSTNFRFTDGATRECYRIEVDTFKTAPSDMAAL